MSEMEQKLARQILRLARMIISNRNKEIQDLGLTAAQADSLKFFADHEGKSVSDLKIHLGVSHQTARGIVERLVDKQVLCQETASQDARVKAVFLTEKGRVLEAKLMQNGTNVVQTLLSGMSSEECRCFCRLIDRALENLESQ